MGEDGGDDAGISGAAPDAESTFRVERGRRVVVHVSGELDALTGDALTALLSEAFDATPESVVVDLRELEFVDSTGLGVLVTAHNRGLTDGIPFEVHNAPPSCLRVFEVTRLIDVLDLH